MYVRIYYKKQNGKIYKTAYLAESIRQGKKTTVRHVLNISHLSEAQIAAIKNAFKAAKKDKETVETDLSDTSDRLQVCNSRPFGAFYVFYELAKGLGLDSLLGRGRDSMLFLYVIIARAIHPASMSATAFWGRRIPLFEVMGLEPGFRETDLYEAIDKVMPRQKEIEDALFDPLSTGKNTSDMFLYKLNSPLLYSLASDDSDDCDGHIEYDNKADAQGQADKPITIWLFTSCDGKPISIRSIDNNAGSWTFDKHIEDMIQRFKVKRITMVCSCGSVQEKAGGVKGLHYVTSVSEVQLKALKSTGSIDANVVDEKLVQVLTEQTRYIIKRCRNVNRQEAIMLGGCSCLKTDLMTNDIGKEVIYERYKSLPQIQQDFRNMDTTNIIYESSHDKDRAEADMFVVMLAMRLLHEFQRKVEDMDEFYDELISVLNEIVCVDEIIGNVRVTKVVKPVGLAQEVIDRLEINLPDVLNVMCPINP
ncbi:MAG: hypothetical protein HQL03_07535 [Nitrospirae bacterium]|nr:hypothetical protein [Nitrospirota bacterium]MBF0592384.1 hypothetical protein [Nitrospirota bacterium]